MKRYSEFIEFNLSSKLSYLKGWTIDKVGYTQYKHPDDLPDEELEIGLTLILSKGNLKRKVILDNNKFGFVIEHVEEIISREFLDAADQAIKKHAAALEALAKGPKCDDPSCGDCNET